VVSTVSTSGERAITAATPAATTAVSPALPGVLRLSFTLVMKSVVDTAPAPLTMPNG
jgi:hypothetical protein